MTTQLTEATESIGGAIASLAECAKTNPEALAALSELVNATEELAVGMEACYKAAQFLKHHNLRAHYAKSLSPIPDNDELLEYLYNCVCCVQESLKVLIVKSFSEKYLAQIRTFPNSVYQQFLRHSSAKYRSTAMTKKQSKSFISIPTPYSIKSMPNSTQIFQNTQTLQVVEVQEIKPGWVNFAGQEISITALSIDDWELCKSDPGYRGMPPAHTNCPSCAGTGIRLNPNVYNEPGNERSGVAPLTVPCECIQKAR
jgi:hypothetical protein